MWNQSAISFLRALLEQIDDNEIDYALCGQSALAAIYDIQYKTIDDEKAKSLYDQRGLRSCLTAQIELHMPDPSLIEKVIKPLQKQFRPYDFCKINYHKSNYNYHGQTEYDVIRDGIPIINILAIPCSEELIHKNRILKGEAFTYKIDTILLYEMMNYLSSYDSILPLISVLEGIVKYGADLTNETRLLLCASLNESGVDRYNKITNINASLPVDLRELGKMFKNAWTELGLDPHRLSRIRTAPSSDVFMYEMRLVKIHKQDDEILL